MQTHIRIDTHTCVHKHTHTHAHTHTLTHTHAHAHTHTHTLSIFFFLSLFYSLSLFHTHAHTNTHTHTHTYTHIYANTLTQNCAGTTNNGALTRSHFYTTRSGNPTRRSTSRWRASFLRRCSHVTNTWMSHVIDVWMIHATHVAWVLSHVYMNELCHTNISLRAYWGRVSRNQQNRPGNSTFDALTTHPIWSANLIRCSSSVLQMRCIFLQYTGDAVFYDPIH